MEVVEGPRCIQATDHGELFNRVEADISHTRAMARYAIGALLRSQVEHCRFSLAVADKCEEILLTHRNKTSDGDLGIGIEGFKLGKDLLSLTVMKDDGAVNASSQK